MPKYLIQASYTAEGVQGLLKDGGSKRRAAAEQAIKASVADWKPSTSPSVIPMSSRTYGGPLCVPQSPIGRLSYFRIGANHPQKARLFC